METYWKNMVFPKNLHLPSRLLHRASFHVIQQNSYHIHVIPLTFECYHDDISYYKTFASKSLRLCGYQHGCPLGRIRSDLFTIEFLLCVASPSQKNYRNSDFLEADSRGNQRNPYLSRSNPYLSRT